MPAHADFDPVAFQIVSDPAQLKAFADPLRNRILHILGDRPATNQQLANSLGEDRAKVLHHVRYLVDAGLAVLVEERIRGGHVLKFYRATARLYGIRATSPSASMTGPVFETLLQEIMASETLWPDHPMTWELRRQRIHPERIQEFNARLGSLIAEYWGGPDQSATPDDDAPLMGFAAITFRHPGGHEVDEDTTS